MYLLTINWPLKLSWSLGKKRKIGIDLHSLSLYDQIRYLLHTHKPSHQFMGGKRSKCHQFFSEKIFMCTNNTFLIKYWPLKLFSTDVMLVFYDLRLKSLVCYWTLRDQYIVQVPATCTYATYNPTIKISDVRNNRGNLNISWTSTKSMT